MTGKATRVADCVSFLLHGAVAMPAVEIDLYSDTITRTTPGMRRAMAEAEVGNEQAHADPSVNRLVEMVADMMGHEAAVFVPSGTMCNAIAYPVYWRQGYEVLLERTAHPIHAEAGGPAALSGFMLNTIDGDDGIFTAEQVEAAIRPYKRNRPRPRLVTVAQTSNFGGGSVWPIGKLRGRSEERRVGEECVRTGRYRWWACHVKKKKHEQN